MRESASNPFDLLLDQFREIVREEFRAVVSKVDPGEDRMMKITEAAKVLDVSEDWLYRHKDKLPFTRRLGPGVLRFSSQGIQKWLATRKVSS